MNGKDCLLDTNIVIGLFANESSITEKIKSFSGSIFIPSIVLGELFYGAEQSTRKDENRKKIEELAEASLVLECDLDTAKSVKSQRKPNTRKRYLDRCISRSASTNFSYQGQALQQY